MLRTTWHYTCRTAHYIALMITFLAAVLFGIAGAFLGVGTGGRR